MQYQHSVRSDRRLQFNPEPIRVVKHRLGEGIKEHRCDYWDGRGRCSSYDTALTEPKYRWLCAKHRGRDVEDDHEVVEGTVADVKITTDANKKRVTLELPAEAIQLLYDVLGHFPHKPGSWSNDARALCSVALMDARTNRPGGGPRLSDIPRLPPVRPGEVRVTEYRVTWQREGRARRRVLYQTVAGAQACAERQRTARDEMTWLQPPLPPLVAGPTIERREVGPWEGDE